MNTEIWTWLLYIGLGWITGFLNTVAGGGTLISMPVLIFMGIPGSVANATIRVAILAQNISAATGFHSKGVRLPFPYSWWLAGLSLAGGWIGANIAMGVPDHLFNRIHAIILVLVVLSIVFEKKNNTDSGEEKFSMKRQVLSGTGFFLLGIYGGFIQAGIGFLVIAMLTHIHKFPLSKTNYIKVFAAILYTGIAVLAFAIGGRIIWEIGLVLAIGNAAGAWFGSRWSVSAGDKWVKRILVVAVMALVVRLWFF
ncbi:MAG: sulfite exporter TauE/SafE family protein [Cyclobacteriaceae bacterium]